MQGTTPAFDPARRPSHTGRGARAGKQDDTRGVIQGRVLTTAVTVLALVAVSCPAGAPRACSGDAGDAKDCGSESATPSLAPSRGAEFQGWAPANERSGEIPRQDALGAATHFDLLVMSPSIDTKLLAEMERAHPSLRLLVYMNAAFDQSRDGDAYPNAWYARDADGSKIRSVAFGNWLMDVTEPGWSRERADDVRAPPRGRGVRRLHARRARDRATPSRVCHRHPDRREDERGVASDRLARSDVEHRGDRGTSRPTGDRRGERTRERDALLRCRCSLIGADGRHRWRYRGVMAPIPEGGTRLVPLRHRLAARRRDALERRGRREDAFSS